MTVNASTDQASPLALDDTASAIASARRAAVADRYAVDSLAVEWRGLCELETIAGEWRELAARALEPNVFYEPAFALAAAGVFGRDAGAVLVWSGTQPRKLLGFFPARIEARRYGLKLPVLVGWTHSYAPLGTPLVEREAAEPVIAAWLAHLARDHALPGLLLLPLLPKEGPLVTALSTIARRVQIPAMSFNQHGRALLAPERGERPQYLERTLGTRKLAQLRRFGRRLADLGSVLFTSTTQLPAIAPAIEDFLALEASGWKGRAGTAAGQHAGIRRFMQATLLALAAENKVSVDRIVLDGHSIAATITLRSGDTAWLWKIAYDESFARYSPGVMLSVAVSEQLLDDPTLVRADSCAPANHPMIDHIWNERLALGDLLLGVRPGAAFSLARRLEALRNGAIAQLQGIRRRFRR